MEKIQPNIFKYIIHGLIKKNLHMAVTNFINIVLNYLHINF